MFDFFLNLNFKVYDDINILKIHYTTLNSKDLFAKFESILLICINVLARIFGQILINFANIIALARLKFSKFSIINVLKMHFYMFQKK